jgi:hypothetical protein
MLTAMVPAYWSGKKVLVSGIGDDGVFEKGRCFFPEFFDCSHVAGSSLTQLVLPWLVTVEIIDSFCRVPPTAQANGVSPLGA